MAHQDVEGGLLEACADKRVGEGDTLLLVGDDGIKKVVGHGHGRSAEAHAAPLGRGYALALAGFYVFALLLGDVGKELQNDVGDELAGEVAVLRAGVQKRHIQNEDIRADVFGYVPPFLYYHIVIASQSVNGLDDEHVALFESAHELFVIFALEVLAGLFVGEDMAFVYAVGEKAVDLSVEILVGSGNTAVSIVH